MDRVIPQTAWSFAHDNWRQPDYWRLLDMNIHKQDPATTPEVLAVNDTACVQLWMSITILAWSLAVLIIATFFTLCCCPARVARRCANWQWQRRVKENVLGRRIEIADMSTDKETEKIIREKRLKELPQDAGNYGQIQETIKEIESFSALSREYRNASTPRRYLGRRIASNTLTEVARFHSDLKITGIFAGSAQEGTGDTLQQIQYLQVSKAKEDVDDVESGSPVQQYAKRPVFSSDLDVMVVPLAVCIGQQRELEYEHVQSKPLSFVMLKPTAGSNLGDLRECITDDGYLSARAAKQLLCDALARSKYVYCGPSVAVSVEEHGVAAEMTWAEPSANGSFFETVLIADFTFALRVPEWPECARGWTERPRNWPSRQLATTIAARGCHAIAFYRDSSDDERHWRLSFSDAELILFAELPPFARDMCIALKALFKIVIQPYCPSLSSYHLKTVVLWVVEQAPSDLFCSSDGAAVGLLTTFTYLSQKIRDGYLQHYFVSGHNILPQMSCEEVASAKNAILDATFYASFHLARLRNFEAKYLNINDFLLVSPLGKTIKTQGIVQEVIQKQLQTIMDMIPTVCDTYPIAVPEEPIFVHLLTGRVFRLSFDFQNAGSKYVEIMAALLREIDDAALKVGCRENTKMNFFSSFYRETMKKTVYVTASSVSNAILLAKTIKWQSNIIRIARFAIIACGIAVIAAAVPTILLARCNSNPSGFSTGVRGNVYNSGGREGDNSEHGLTAVDLYGTVRSGTNVLSDVHISLPSYRSSGVIRG